MDYVNHQQFMDLIKSDKGFRAVLAVAQKREKEQWNQYGGALATVAIGLRCDGNDGVPYWTTSFLLYPYDRRASDGPWLANLYFFRGWGEWFQEASHESTWQNVIRQSAALVKAARLGRPWLFDVYSGGPIRPHTGFPPARAEELRVQCVEARRLHDELLGVGK